MAVKIGVDTGGTFSDFMLMDGDTLVIHKVLSTPDNPARAVLQGAAPSPARPDGRGRRAWLNRRDQCLLRTQGRPYRPHYHTGL